MVDEDERIDLVESSAAANAELLLRPATVETTDKPSLRVVIVAEKKLQNVIPIFYSTNGYLRKLLSLPLVTGD